MEFIGAVIFRGSMIYRNNMWYKWIKKYKIDTKAFKNHMDVIRLNEEEVC